MPIRWRPDRPTSTTVENKRLSQILEKRYFPDHDDGEATEVRVFDQDTDFFRGLAAAGISEARDIVEALEKFCTIIIKRDTPNAS